MGNLRGNSNILLQMSIRSGGHDYICASLKNDSLHLDLRKINVIDLLPESEVPDKVSRSELQQGLCL